MAFKYPIDLNERTTDYVTFSHFEWKLNRSLSGSGVGSYSQGFMADPPSRGGDIVLYVPNSTPPMSQQQDYKSDSQPGELGQLRRNLAAAAAGIGYSGNPEQAVQRALDGLSGALSKDGIGTALSAGRQAMVEAVATAMQQDPKTIIALGSGSILNPNVEVVYQGPMLRSFNFDFTFAPKDSSEAKAIKDIIFEFKRWSAPESPEQIGGMMKVPDVWRVKYGGKFGKNGNPFKRAVLTNVNVDFNSGLNQHMTFDDGEPILIGLGLSFRETDFITRGDHMKARGAGYMGGF